MAHIETARVNEVIGLQIGAVQEFAEALNVDCALEELEATLGSLETAVADLKSTLKAIPHRPA